MLFNNKTRALNSRTGYFKKKETEELYNTTIYLGIYDSPNNYIPITKEEYLKVLLERKLAEDESNNKR